MKNSIFLLFILAGSNLFGQTDSLEKTILYNKLISKEITEATYAKIWPQWVQTMNSYDNSNIF